MTDAPRVGTAFIPVSDPETAARWYEAELGFSVRSTDEYAAVLEGVAGAGAVTLMGPRSGISAQPGLPWATCNFVVEDLDAARARLDAAGWAPSAVDGAADVCLFFTVRDPDGNTLLVVDR